MITLTKKNKIFCPASSYTENKDFYSFCEGEATFTEDTGRAVNKYYFYKEVKKGNLHYYEFTRGLESSLLSFLRSKGAEVVVKEEYSKNEQIEIISRIEKLRDYQIELERELGGADEGYVIVPTGGGKTVVMINEIVRKKESAFVLVHTKQLLDQFIERLLVFTDLKREDIGIYGKGKKEIKKVTIALMQSFGKLGGEEIKEATGQKGLFMIDEAHHLTAKTFFHIASNITSKRVYGLTATPDKRGGLSTVFLEKTIGPLLYKVTESELEKTGEILKPEIYPVINEDSFIVDIYKDSFTTDDGSKITKFNASQFLSNNLKFDLKYVNPEKCTIVESGDTKELNFFYNSLSPSLKDRVLYIPSPLYKNHSSILRAGVIVFCLSSKRGNRQVDMHKIKSELYERASRADLVIKTILESIQSNPHKDPYILVLSDRIEHIEFMYSRLPERLKAKSIVFHGGLKAKEKREGERLIDRKEVRIIFSIDKFVGEGWDKPFLDTLIVTHTIKDHEGLKQLVGRVIRKSPGKHTARVYDIVDSNNPITMNQYKKRLFNYYKKHGILKK